MSRHTGSPTPPGAQPDERAVTARRRLRSMDSGVLSTLSRELSGYPFGSITPYVVTAEGRVAVYVSTIAEHTRNMDFDPRSCLTVLSSRNEPGREPNPQALWRITVVGDAVGVPEASVPAVRERYFAFFPESRSYGGTHDFRFYWIETRRVRYIAGFGQIYWVEPDDWTLSTPEWAADEPRIVDHMNADHATSLLQIARRHGASDTPPVTMLALDPEGFHVRAGAQVLYIPFGSPCGSSEQVRAEMTRLARECADPP